MRIDYSGFRKAKVVINQSLMTRQLILSTRLSQKIHNSIGTPQCTFRQLWYNMYILSQCMALLSTPLVLASGILPSQLLIGGNCNLSGLASGNNIYLLYLFFIVQKEYKTKHLQFCYSKMYLLNINAMSLPSNKLYFL